MNPSDWKYEFVRRRTYDNYVDRTGKRIVKMLKQIAIFEAELARMGVLIDAHLVRLPAVPKPHVEAEGRHIPLE